MANTRAQCPQAPPNSAWQSVPRCRGREHSDFCPFLPLRRPPHYGGREAFPARLPGARVLGATFLSGEAHKNFRDALNVCGTPLWTTASSTLASFGELCSELFGECSGRPRRGAEPATQVFKGFFSLFGACPGTHGTVWSLE